MNVGTSGDFYKSPRRGETINNVAEVESRAELVRAMPRCSNVSVANVAEVESRAELVRAMPRCSNVSKKHGTSRRRSAAILNHQALSSRRDATYKQN